MANQKIIQRQVATASTAGNFDSDAAGTTDAMATVNMTVVQPGSLCADLTVDIESASLTMALNWQVSMDGTTFTTVSHASNNPAAVVLGTGTGGADAAISRIVPAPDCVYTFPYARAALTTAGATGATTDTYDVKYRYLRAQG
jgi:hypothetical protein